MCGNRQSSCLLHSPGVRLWSRGKRAFDSGDYASAARLFEQAHKASPNCEILFFIGLARYRLKQSEPALIAFRSATECDPKLIPAHLALAEAYGERHNDSEALAAYDRVLSLDPKNAAALSRAANTYLKGKSNSRTVELLEVLVAVTPADADAHADLAAAYAAAGDRQRAEEQFQIALKIKPDHASALMGLGNVSLKNGEEERAIELLRKAVQAAPNAFEPDTCWGLRTTDWVVIRMPWSSSKARFGAIRARPRCTITWRARTADLAVRTSALKHSPGSRSLRRRGKRMPRVSGERSV